MSDHIAYLETERLAQEKAKDLFESVDLPTSNPSATTNLVGDFDLEVEKFSGNPQLYALLLKYKEVFGPLPPPQEACPLVQMDLILKPEWEGKALRQKCWPLPKADQEELELQAEELVKAGLAEAYPPGKFPEVCSPTFLVDKKDSKTRRMVIQFKKLNARCKPHAAYLPCSYL